jgi:hypothetical protein
LSAVYFNVVSGKIGKPYVKVEFPRHCPAYSNFPTLAIVIENGGLIKSVLSTAYYIHYLSQAVRVDGVHWGVKGVGIPALVVVVMGII